MTEKRLVIWVNSNVSRGKAAAAAVHAALNHVGIDHGPVIVLGAKPPAIEAECTSVVHDAGRTEVTPGTTTAGIAANNEFTYKHSTDAAKLRTVDIVSFIDARLKEHERSLANPLFSALPGPDHKRFLTLARNDIEAKRKILHSGDNKSLRLLSQLWSSHHDFNPIWSM